mmetsp:Transcript_8832/g.20635  ORF Transcript_8832/g.20635 Transcript_8832/m.20635 type:complete len:320 (+) Transcript_8832:1143-2102(+)
MLVPPGAHALDDGCEALEDEVVEGGVLGGDAVLEALAQITQDRGQLGHEHGRGGGGVALGRRDEAHDALHYVGVLLGGFVLEATKEVGEEGLQHGLDVGLGHARHGAVLDREHPLNAASGVRVDDAIWAREEDVEDGEYDTVRLLWQLVAEGQHKLEEVSHEDWVLGDIGGGNSLQVCEHVPLEEVDEVYVGVGTQHSPRLCLCLCGEGDEEVEGCVLALPVCAVCRVQAHQRIHLLVAKLCGCLLKVRAHGIDEGARHSAPRVRSPPLKVPLHVLEGVILKVFLVTLSDPQTRHNHVCDDALEVRRLEEGVVSAFEYR